MEQFESYPVPADNHAPFKKWFGYLVKLQYFRILVMIVTAIPGATVLSPWLGRLAGILSVFLLFQLSAATPRYRKAALFRGTYVAGELFGALVRSSAFSMLFSICSLIGVYQEYHGHSESCVSKDYPLSEKWRGLFWWQMGVGLVGGFLTATGVVIGVLAGLEEGFLTNLMVAFVALLSLVPELFALNYLKKMNTLFQ